MRGTHSCYAVRDVVLALWTVQLCLWNGVATEWTWLQGLFNFTLVRFSNLREKLTQHTHTYTHIHTRMHTQTHTHTHTHIHTHTHTHTHTRSFVKSCCCAAVHGHTNEPHDLFDPLLPLWVYLLPVLWPEEHGSEPKTRALQT